MTREAYLMLIMQDTSVIQCSSWQDMARFTKTGEIQVTCCVLVCSVRVTNIWSMPFHLPMKQWHSIAFLFRVLNINIFKDNYPWIIFSGLENVRPNDSHISWKEPCEYISWVSVESWDDGSGWDIYNKIKQHWLPEKFGLLWHKVWHAKYVKCIPLFMLHAPPIEYFLVTPQVCNGWNKHIY
jgi:hypothetical protein